MTGLAGDQRATLVLGFGRTGAEAQRTARSGLRAGARQTATRYDRGWHRYLRGLKEVPDSAAAVRRQYLASALVLAAAEDKLNPGALVASPSAPWVWGDEVKDLSSPSGAYHLVWSRDSYQFGTALWAMGDKAAARRIGRLALRRAAAARRLVPAELRRRRGRRSGPSSSSTRWRCRSCWPGWSAATGRAPTAA